MGTTWSHKSYYSQEGITFLSMLILYTMTGCGYCAVALRKLDELGLSFEERNIDDPAISAELIARGGKRQVPYLVDEAKGVEMYESENIAEYLEQNYR
jgi:glutaredoxin